MEKEARPVKKRRNPLLVVLFVLFQAGVIAYTAVVEFGKRPPEDTALEFASHGWLYLLAAVFCLVAAYGADTAKNLLMMRALGERVSFRTALETAAIGRYYDAVTPSGAGGEPMQMWWLHRNGYSAGAAGAMPIVSFLTNQIGFVLLAGVTFLLWKPEEPESIRYFAYLGLLLLLTMPTLIALFTFFPAGARRVVTGGIRFLAKLRLIRDPDALEARAMRTLAGYHDSMALIAGDRRLLTLLLLSVAHRIAMCSIPYFVLLSLDGHGSYVNAAAMTVYIYAAVILMPTPGHSGAAEGIFYLAFSETDAQGVFWAMLLWRLLTVSAAILGGVLTHSLDIGRKRPEKEDPPGEAER